MAPTAPLPVPRPIARPAACPFLGLARGDALASPHGRMCLLREAPFRVPSRDELSWLCLSGCYHGCPTYRRHREERPWLIP